MDPKDILHNENDSRGIFYIKEDHKTIAELTYSRNDDHIVIDHTQVEPECEGRGLGTLLIERSVKYARNNELKVDPLCPFAEVVFDRHDEWNDLRM